MRERKDLLDDLRSNDLARTAPGCEGIEDDDLVVLKSGLELYFAVHHVSISPLLSRRVRSLGRAGVGEEHTWKDCGHPF
jgi:hypothetical protein